MKRKKVYDALADNGSLFSQTVVVKTGLSISGVKKDLFKTSGIWHS